MDDKTTAKYRCLMSVHRDNIEYDAGAEISLSAEDARPLLDAQAIAPWDGSLAMSKAADTTAEQIDRLRKTVDTLNEELRKEREAKGEVENALLQAKRANGDLTERFNGAQKKCEALEAQVAEMEKKTHVNTRKKGR